MQTNPELFVYSHLFMRYSKYYDAYANTIYIYIYIYTHTNFTSLMVESLACRHGVNFIFSNSIQFHLINSTYNLSIPILSIPNPFFTYPFLYTTFYHEYLFRVPILILGIPTPSGIYSK